MLGNLNNLRRKRGMQRIDPRQVETFLASPAVVEDIGPAAAQKWGSYVAKEKFKTKWIREGNVILPSGEFIKGEEFGKLPPDEQVMLQRLGLVDFNKFREENIKLESGEWLSKATNEYRVLGAILDGYSTYREIEQVTGLTGNQISTAISKLKNLGLVK